MLTDCHSPPSSDSPSHFAFILSIQFALAAIKTGIIALAEGVAVRRSFAQYKNYHIDDNKEIIALAFE
ncbi:unnamed protein product [Linum trigynum]|uniref:SLC26A/SulP transporter domain-containing protein n=1 Tax=Linum trigynum TaxID=586398 RepID=A0AAV2E721_9ROSI